MESNETHETTAVAVPPKRGMLAIFEQRRSAIEPFLTTGRTIERVAADTYLAVKANPALSECDRESLVLAVAKALQLDLEIGRTAHLVPYGQKVTMIPDYKGMIELVVSSGAARDVDAQCVYANEIAEGRFTISLGTRGEIIHSPILDPTKRGKLVGVYAIARLTAYIAKHLYMAIEEVDAIRQAHSKQWKKGEVPLWYMKKTAIRQLCKLIPQNPKLAAKLALLDRMEDDEIPAGAFEVVGDVTPAPRPPLPDVPGEPRRGPYEEQASLDGNHAIDKGVRRPVSRTVVAAPVEGAARLHPALTESDPYDAAPVLSEEELDRLTQEQDERSARAGR